MAMTTKHQVLKVIEALPDDVTLPEILEELRFRAGFEAGLASLERGEGVPHEVVKKRMEKWLED